MALYAAFGVIALWLLWEVLMQYKAPLRWRALAFVGFLCVVLGVLMPSAVVIGVGVVMFAIGQTKVTFSYRSGYSGGWVMSKRGDREDYDDRYEAAAYDHRPAEPPPPDRPGGYPAYEPEPALSAPAPAAAAEQTAQFSAFGAEQPYPTGYDTYGDGAAYDSGSYATTSAYDSGSYATTSAYDSGSYATTSAYDTGTHATTGGYEAGGYATNGTGMNGYGQDQQIYPDAGGYGTEHQYAGYDTSAGYADPYGGTEYAAQTPSYYDSPSYDTGAGYPGYDQQRYAQYDGGYDTGQQPAYGQETYGTQGDGVWIPQQRDADPLGTEDPYAQQPGYPGYEQQYRY
ncbi:hypothetical protein [Streptomyces sp. MAR4 CNX-425]|uniref:hypothetical protein n=1 Tax=Streptomyces sp. MAR4 CNX-425 TaxID=3406343 RepID=UPI003B503863